MLAASPASAGGGSTDAAEAEPQAKAEIIVAASLDKPLVTTLGDLEVKDTPLSIATYDRELLDTVQARNIGTVVRFDPAVTSQPASGGFGAAVSIRGFDVGSVFDGLPTPAVDLYRVNTVLFATERVTVLRGVSSLIYAGSSFTLIGGGNQYRA
jgi:outer membrane receptor protein involved in Fe transport